MLQACIADLGDVEPQRLQVGEAREDLQVGVLHFAEAEIDRGFHFVDLDVASQSLDFSDRLGALPIRFLPWADGRPKAMGLNIKE